MSVDDWVQPHGAFWFVRVRNRSTEAILVGDGQIENCANVKAGCGTVDRHITVAPHSVATLAAVAGGSAVEPPSFTYRYQAHLAGYAFAGSGSSKKTPPAGAAPISAHELQTAEAPLLAELKPLAAVKTAEPAPPPRPVVEASAPVTLPPEIVITPVPTLAPPPPTREPTVTPTPDVRTPTPTRRPRRFARATPTPTPPPRKPHSFQHLLPRGFQHWLIH